MSTPAMQNSSTCYWSLSSLYDPDFSNLGSNKSVPFFNELLGATNGLYRYFRVKYVDVRVRVINTTTATFPYVVVGCTSLGTAQFPTTAYIHNIAGYPMTNGKILEYSGDTTWKEFVFRVNPWEVLGIQKAVWDEDTHYYNLYTANSGTIPWLTISMGDGMAGTGNGDAMTINGSVDIDYHCSLHEPVLLTAA